jgi:hypothetical protein
MSTASLDISERINRPMDEVYAYAVDPANLPEWAPGLGSAVENIDGRWYIDAPMGRVGFAFVGRNALGVLDHEVVLPSGDVIYNPMRVIPDGDACDMVFTLRRSPDMNDEEFERDANAVAADLASLKRIMERRESA